MKKSDLPVWLTKSENYYPKNQKFAPINFLVQNLKKFELLNKTTQKSEKKDINIFNFIIFLLSVLLLSLAKSGLFIWIMGIIFLFKLALLSVPKIRHIIKVCLIAGAMCLIILSPMLILDRSKFNILFFVKTLVILLDINLFTIDLSIESFISLCEKLHISSTIIFILGIMGKYLVVLNNSLIGLMSSIQVRSVGKLRHSYQIIGGIFGTLYLNSIKISKDVHDAMIVRCYTGEFVQKKTKLKPEKLMYGILRCTGLFFLFIFLGR